MVKKFFIFGFAIIILGNAASVAIAQNSSTKEININFFYSAICPYCIQEKAFLGQLSGQFPEVKVSEFEISEKISVELLQEYYQDYEVPAEKKGLVPITFIEDRYFLAFDDKIGEDIKNYIKDLIEGLNPGAGSDSGKIVTLPFIGEINLLEFSPLALAVVLGILDGFNVCSLGALVLILGLVLVLKSKIKIFIFGGTYIITTAVIYGLLILFWYKLFVLFTPYLRLMEILIGLLGIGGGIYLLRQFFRIRKHGPTCEVDTGSGIISKLSLKMKELLKNPGNLFIMMGSIFLFAAIITIVEFPCSAVVPVAFAGVLAQSKLSALGYLLYIAVFIFFYMIDELIIFTIAVLTATIWLTSKKFITWIILAEAIILLLLGLYYIFAANF